jgi:hypothetical protein
VEGEEDGRLRRLRNWWDEPERTVAAGGRRREFFFPQDSVFFLGTNLDRGREPINRIFSVQPMYELFYVEDGVRRKR